MGTAPCVSVPISLQRYRRRETMGILRQGTFEPTKTNGENDCLKKSLPEDYKKVGIPTYKSVTDEFEIYKTAIANESGKFNISEIYTSDGLTMIVKKDNKTYREFYRRVSF